MKTSGAEPAKVMETRLGQLRNELGARVSMVDGRDRVSRLVASLKQPTGMRVSPSGKVRVARLEISQKASFPTAMTVVGAVKELAGFFAGN